MPEKINQNGKEKSELIEEDIKLNEKERSDLLYLEQMNSYCQNTVNTPEYITAMSLYTQALNVIEERYGDREHLIYRIN